VDTREVYEVAVIGAAKVQDASSSGDVQGGSRCEGGVSRSEGAEGEDVSAKVESEGQCAPNEESGGGMAMDEEAQEVLSLLALLVPQKYKY
jgi:hypothetical protein